MLAQGTGEGIRRNPQHGRRDSPHDKATSYNRGLDRDKDGIACEKA